MRMNIGKLRQKCSDEKYYEAVKYMAHTLEGNDRYYFIKQVCKCNIYLGTICATTCEYDRRLDKYIRSVLNNFFTEKKVKYTDRKTGQVYEYVKQHGKKDVDLFILASYEIGNFNAIKWAIYNFKVNINTLIRIGQKVSEEEYVEILDVIRKSQNSEKMDTMCRARSLSTQKNNPRANSLLKYYWNNDKQIFTYLADCFGRLSELEKDERYGEMIYAKCFEGADNSIPFNNVIINALSSNYKEGLERLFRIINNYGSDEAKKNLYMLVYMKLQNHLPVYRSEYTALRSVPYLDKRELFLGKKTILRVLNTDCSDWINVFDFIYYFPVREEMNLFVGSFVETRNLYPLNRYLEEYPYTNLNRIVYTYFNTPYKEQFFLDDFVMTIAEHCRSDVNKICELLNAYEDVGRAIQTGQKSYFFHEWKTLKYPVMDGKVVLGKNYRLMYVDYDYISHRFHVTVVENSVRLMNTFK